MTRVPIFDTPPPSDANTAPENTAADSVAARDAQQKLRATESRLLGPYMTSTGRDAFDGHDAVLADYDRARADIAARLPSPRARQFFQDLTAPRSHHVAETLHRHRQTGFTTWQGQLNQNARDQNAADALEYGLSGGTINPTAISRHKGLGRLELIDQAAREAWSADQLQAAVTDYESAIDRSLISALITRGDPDQATAYFHANRGRIKPALRAEIETTLTHEINRKQTTEIADHLWQQSGHDPATAMAETDQISDPARRRRVQSAITQTHRAEMAEQTATRDDAYQRGQQLVQDGGNPHDLSLADQNAMGQALFDNLVAAHEAGPTPRTSTAGRAALDRIYGLTDPEQLVEIDSFALKSQLSPPDHATLENHLAAARAHAAAIDGHAAAKPGSTATAPPNPLDRSATRYLQGLFDALGLTGAAYAPARGAVQAALMRDVQSFTAQHGRTPNDRERRDMIDRQLIEAAGIAGPAPDMAAEHFPDDLPEQTRKSIETAFHRLGLQPDQGQVMRAWQSLPQQGEKP